MDVVIEETMSCTGVFKSEESLGSLKALVDARISSVIAPKKILANVIGRKNGKLPLMQFDVLATDSAILDAVETEHLCECLYQHPADEWVEKLLKIDGVR